jgi:uncharacterized protein
MSASLPDSVDVWRMVMARRSFEGTLAVATLPRLVSALAGDAGTVRFTLEFGRDAFGTAFLSVQAQADLTLICQRSLEPFVCPVTVDSRLGLIREEREEAALLPGYEPLLVDAEPLHLASVIEDELLLALPLVPMRPGSEDAVAAWAEPVDDELEPVARAHPFAALRTLK